MLYIIETTNGAVVTSARDEKNARKNADHYCSDEPARVILVADDSFLIEKPYRLQIDKSEIDGEITISA